MKIVFSEKQLKIQGKKLRLLFIHLVIYLPKPKRKTIFGSKTPDELRPHTQKCQKPCMSIAHKTQTKTGI